jgi:hypothetical protein
MNAWGLAQRNETTVPDHVVLFFESNMANEWWAEAGIPTHTAPIKAKIADL